jgi:L-alanine-DL-glutamate epimerase-like enolase superfamily enzyme
MGTVVEIETIVCRLPKRRDLVTRIRATTESGRFVERPGTDDRVLVRLRTDDGRQGWGEATAIPTWGGMGGRYYGESCDTVVHVIHDMLSTRVLGHDPLDLTAILGGFHQQIKGHPYAKSAVETALQDLRGQYCGQPIYRLLGGAVRPRVWIAHMLSLMADDEALMEARRAAENDGVTAFQVKGGVQPKRDVRLISLLRENLPHGTFLRLDANQGYGNEPKRVASIVRQLASAGADAIEQPASSIDAMAAASRAVAIPILADESCWQPTDVLNLHDAGAADGVSVYVMKAGGISEAHDVATVANLFGWPCDVNGSLETGVGTAASIHVALASQNATLPSVISVPSRRGHFLTDVAGRYWDDDIVVEGFHYEKGGLTVLGNAGLGIVVDYDAVKAAAVSARTSTK